MKFEMPKILLTLLFIIACSPSAFAFSYNNCNLTAEYGSGITSRSIAVYGLAHYEILAALNIHSRAISLGGVNRNSQKFNLWVNARSGQHDMSHYKLTRSAVEYAQKLKSLPNRYPTAAILKAQKAKLFLADYYHGIYPPSARTVRKNMHDEGIATYLATRQCKYDQDSKYRPTFQTLFADIGRIAAITGRNSRAKQLIGGYQTRLLQLDRKLQGIKKKRVFYYQGGAEQLYGPPPSSIAIAIIRRAGAVNYGVKAVSDPALKWSDLRGANLDHILIPFNGDVQGLNRQKQLVAEHLKNTRAAKQIIVIYEQDWQDSPAAIAATESLAVALHPEAFPKNFLKR